MRGIFDRFASLLLDQGGEFLPAAEYHPAGVDQPEPTTLPLSLKVNTVPGYARLVADDRPAAPRDAVE